MNEELTPTQAADIEKQFGGNSWLELMDITIPARYQLEVADIMWMSQDYTDYLYHILITNGGNNCAVYAPNWCTGLEDDWKIYNAVPYQRDECADTQGNQGEVNTQITLGDMSGYLQRLMARFDGMIGFSVQLIQGMAIEDSEHTPPTPAEGIPPFTVVEETGLRLYFKVGTTTHNRTNFTMTLETALPLEWHYPYRKIIKSSCQWCFKSAECGYTGNDIRCARTIADCRAKGNITRFGAFPGCGVGGLGQ